MTKEISKAMVAPDKRRYPTVVPRREGKQAIADCPYCGKEHVHGWGEGHRVADCFGPGSGAGYYLDCGGDDGDEPEMSAEEFIRHLKAMPLEQILATGDDDMRAKAMAALAQDYADSDGDD